MYLQNSQIFADFRLKPVGALLVTKPIRIPVVIHTIILLYYHRLITFRVQVDYQYKLMTGLNECKVDWLIDWCKVNDISENWYERVKWNWSMIIAKFIENMSDWVIIEKNYIFKFNLYKPPIKHMMCRRHIIFGSICCLSII